MSCGANHTIVMTSDGLIYGWGLNKWGQTGIGKSEGERIRAPLLLKSLANIDIKSLDCGYGSIVCADNRMFCL